MFYVNGKETVLVVVTSSPFNLINGNQILCISLQSVLDLMDSNREVKLNLLEDFTNEVDMGLIIVTPQKVKQIIRWQANNRAVTLKLNVGGSYKIGYIEEEKLGLTEKDIFWLKTYTEELVRTANEPVKKKTKSKDKRKKDRMRTEKEKAIF
jgi:hypothetical protein